MTNTIRLTVVPQILNSLTDTLLDSGIRFRLNKAHCKLIVYDPISFILDETDKILIAFSTSARQLVIDRANISQFEVYLR